MPRWLQRFVRSLVLSHLKISFSVGCTVLPGDESYYLSDLKLGVPATCVPEPTLRLPRHPEGIHTAIRSRYSAEQTPEFVDAKNFVYGCGAL
jgi:hypothetical protein